MKTAKEILEEVKEGYRASIRNGDLAVSDQVERAYAESGEYIGAWVTVYAFVDDSDEEE